MQLLLDDNTSGSDFLALMMPTRRYLRSAVVRKHKSRDRPRPRQLLLARVRPDRVRYASGAPVVELCRV